MALRKDQNEQPDEQNILDNAGQDMYLKRYTLK